MRLFCLFPFSREHFFGNISWSSNVQLAINSLWFVFLIMRMLGSAISSQIPKMHGVQFFCTLKISNWIQSSFLCAICNPPCSFLVVSGQLLRLDCSVQSREHSRGHPQCVDAHRQVWLNGLLCLIKFRYRPDSRLCKWGATGARKTFVFRLVSSPCRQQLILRLWTIWMFVGIFEIRINCCKLPPIPALASSNWSRFK